jgi:predicted esterase
VKVPERDPQQGVRDASRVGAALLLAITLPIALGAWGQPISERGTAWLVAAAVAIVGLAIGSRAGRALAGLAVLGWLGIIAVTLAWPAQPPTFLRAIEIPSGEASGRGARIFSERDVSVVGARVMYGLGAVGPLELEGFVPALDAVYDEIEASEGTVTSTPFLATVLGEQRAARFDAFVHEEPAPAERWVVFLHGYGGSFASVCWVVALAAADAGASTICPATSFAGLWHEGHGPGIVRASIDWIRGRGARSIVLVGLSNGGIGASRLARELAADLDGLALISGLDDRAPHPAMPTFVWHGTTDTRFPIGHVRAWAATLARGELVEVDGDHFALIEQRALFAPALSGFLRRAHRSTAVAPLDAHGGPT